MIPVDDDSLFNDDSLIFERNVEDPYISTAQGMSPSHTLVKTSSNTNTPSSPLSLSRHQSCNSISSNVLLPSITNSSTHNGLTNTSSYNPVAHHTLENLIPPALDAGCSIVTDENTDLNDIDMIYSRRPSTIGLNMALGNFGNNSNGTNPLGLSKSYSHTIPTKSTLYSTSSASKVSPCQYLRRSYSNSYSPRFPSVDGSNTPTNTNKVLRFYSYADMLSDEMNLSPIPTSQQQGSSNEEVHYCNGDDSSKNFRSPTDFNDPFSADQQSVRKSDAKNKQNLSKFHIDSSSSDSSTDDEEYEENDDETTINNNKSALASLLQHPNPNFPPNSLGPRVLRTRSSSTAYTVSNNNSNGNMHHPPALLHTSTAPVIRARTYSQSTGISPPTTPSSPTQSSNYVQTRRTRSPSQYFIYNDDALSPLQTDKIGEVLRKKISRTSESPTIDGSLR